MLLQMGLTAMLAYALINDLQIGCEIVNMIDMRRHSINGLICSEMQDPQCILQGHSIGDNFDQQYDIYKKGG